MGKGRNARGRSGRMPAELREVLVWRERIHRIDETVTRIDGKVDSILGTIVSRCGEGEMRIRVQGARRIQFVEAIRVKRRNRMLDLTEVCKSVIARMPEVDGERGYPNWRSLYRYANSMNKRYGCFEPRGRE